MPKSSAQGSGQESKTSRSSRTRAEVPDPAHEGEEVTPELADAVDPLLPTSAELAVSDPSDQHEVMLRMDDHDVRMLLQQVQSSALRKWVYELEGRRDKDGKPVRGLTIHAVQDVVQRINWTGKARIGVMPETLEVDRIVENAGNGDEAFWVATIFARDEVTGQVLPGSSMEPVYMQLRKSTAARKRSDGAEIPDDNRVFDSFSRWKAIQKATRNALGGFIPEEIEQTVIAMFGNDPSRVERIQTEAQVKAEELPPLDDETRERIARAEAIYDEIRELGGGRGKVDFPPGVFNAYLFTARRDGTWEPFMAYLEKRRTDMKAGYAGQSS